MKNEEVGSKNVSSSFSFSSYSKTGLHLAKLSSRTAPTYFFIFTSYFLLFLTYCFTCQESFVFMRWAALKF